MEEGLQQKPKKKTQKQVGEITLSSVGGITGLSFSFSERLMRDKKGGCLVSNEILEIIYHLKIYGAELAKLGPKNRFCNILKLWVGLQVGSNFPMNDLKSYKAVSK